MNSLHSNCLLCNSTQFTPLFIKDNGNLVTCNSCDFVFFQTIPTVLELEEYYKNYHNVDYLSPVTIKRYHEILDKLEPYRESNNILDIGCGVGYFLSIAKERGWNVYGTEYSDINVTICEKKGITMQKGGLEQVNFTNGFFDAITSFEVIEHINNPIEEINKIYTLLKPKGAVYITTPNYNALERYFLKDQYNVISYPEHLEYFTPKTIHKLLSEHGFKKVTNQTSGISVSRIKTSLGKSEEKIVEKDNSDDQLRSYSENSLLGKIIKNSINYFLNIIGKGNALKVLYEK